MLSAEITITKEFLIEHLIILLVLLGYYGDHWIFVFSTTQELMKEDKMIYFRAEFYQAL